MCVNVWRSSHALLQDKWVTVCYFVFSGGWVHDRVWYSHSVPWSLAQLSMMLFRKLIPVSHCGFLGHSVIFLKFPPFLLSCSGPSLFLVVAWGSHYVYPSPMVASTFISPWHFLWSFGRVWYSLSAQSPHISISVVILNTREVLSTQPVYCSACFAFMDNLFNCVHGQVYPWIMCPPIICISSLIIWCVMGTPS